MANRLVVRDFAQIREASIEFGDLTILVGPQATGKSLLLQWLKMALDGAEVVRALKEAGESLQGAGDLLDLFFGQGMSSAWKTESIVEFNGTKVDPSLWKSWRVRSGSRGERVFFVPAHRAMLLSDGWPSPFVKLNADTPVVARLFSQNLYHRFSGRQSTSLFPMNRVLKSEFRDLIDKAVFHGGRVDLVNKGFKKQLGLKFKDTELPFMTWTAGQREFTPLLLGLYRVLTARGGRKDPDIEWVVIEEPEMGLHPSAIAAFMVLVLDLLWRDYKVAISTHSPLVLEIIWAIRELAAATGPKGWKGLSQAFGAGESTQIQRVMENALRRDYQVYYMGIDGVTGEVASKNISELSPDSDDPEVAEWGGLTEFSTRFGNAIRSAVNAAASR